MIIIGLIALLAAVIVGVAGVLNNSGDTHALTDDFAVFGYHVTGSTGTLFLYGIAVGAIGMCGLSLLLAGALRGRRARRELHESRRESADGNPGRDNVEPGHESVAANQPPHGADRSHRSTGGRDWRHPFGHRSESAATTRVAH
ncbi:hypothetical protein [Rhodococcus tibetensis]|uniref:Integral membrane protein n=1 Tax=Rhodococcus tibetensis TaxID=2965064 RepID=A0ABT1QD25_9NOCA|nr:hypothetical protein [Rhodococcus sp. FXJ9.536]MCQ4119593.1 hypothetical protein [Rhodococcus sp. FXJ9.536]